MKKDMNENKVFEIRWHGRGGQGAKTASEMFAGILFKAGKFVQSFPEFGPERAGAPMTAFNRISNSYFRKNYNVYTPDLLVIVDKSLISLDFIFNGLKEDGVILLNISKENFEKLNLEKKIKEKTKCANIYIIDADKISIEELGKAIPNVSLMSALAKILDFPAKEEFLKAAKEEIEEKFNQKKSVIDGNIKTLERSYNEVIKI